MQLMLDINSGLSLRHETDQTQYQEYCCDQVFPSSSQLCIALRAFTPSVLVVVKHRSAFNVPISVAPSGFSSTTLLLQQRLFGMMIHRVIRGRATCSHFVV